MGVVYRARDEQLARDVALKLLTTDVESEPDTQKRFFREAQITGKLIHRNIVTVLDVGQDDGRLFIVMELLNGETLTQLLKRPVAPPLEQKIDLMVQACEGLSFAHSKGIVHRDIKPANLFVMADGGLKILDFGVARLASSTMTGSGLIIGTPDYMSPEQARGQEVDARSDVFSMAAVFYLMLTGRKPFDASNLPLVLQKVIREDPLPIREDEAPRPLTRIIAKALRKDPNDRHRSSADFGSDLIRYRRQFDNERRQRFRPVRERGDDVSRNAAKVREARTTLQTPAATSVPDLQPSLSWNHSARATPPLSATTESGHDPDDTVILAVRSQPIRRLVTDIVRSISEWARNRHLFGAGR
jgi:serine/threonine protein kinase